MTVLSKKSFKRVLLALPLLVLPFAAAGQDFFHGGMSAQTTARGGIFTPGSNSVVDALTLNPAGLTSLNGPTADMLLGVGVARGSFSNAANPNSTMRMRPAFAAIGGVGTRFGHSRWSGAVGGAPDFFSSVNWHYKDSPGAAGANYGSQEEKSEIVAYRASAGVGFAAGKRFSAGATVGMVYNENTLIAPFIFQQNASLKGLKTLVNLHTHGLGWGGSVGVTGRPSNKLTLNAAYTSPIAVNSRGNVSGNMGAQFQAAGIPFQPAFTYDARVRIKLPASVIVGGRWQATKTTGISLQGDYAHFRGAFDKLPIWLTNGSNADINGFLKSNAIQDVVPLNWSDQYTMRAAVDRSVGEHYTVSGGYTRRSSLVPNGTVTPLTAAIMKNGLSSGVQYAYDGVRLAAAYTINLNQTANVGTSGLLAGEYSNSRTTVGTQAVVLGVSVQLGKGPH